MPQPTATGPHVSLNLPFRRSSTKVTNLTSDREKRDRSTSLDPSHRPLKGTMDLFSSKDKRKSLGLPGGLKASTKGSPKGSPSFGPAKPATLIIDLESPPLCFYGTPQQSSGALLSAKLLLTVTDPDVRLQDFNMVLEAKVTTKKPVSKDCPDCQTKTTELFAWRFLTEPNRFKKGVHDFPFSYLLPGHLPATTHGDLGVVDYVLSAKATTSLSDTITVKRALIVQRALVPGMDKNSVRIFPPTNLTATVVLPSVIHPIGEFPVQMRLTGIVDNSIKDLQRRWRIRKMIYRIEESTRMISAACSKHAHKIGGEGKGILHENIRSIGGDDLKSGWKTDFETGGGEIEFEFKAVIKPSSRPICDVESPTGLAATHSFMLEIIVAEEQTAQKAGKHASPTGAARVLRMQFKVIVTERSGMGISWDEEMPPMYEDVPNSPPRYQKLEEYDGDLGPDEELENMTR